MAEASGGCTGLVDDELVRLEVAPEVVVGAPLRRDGPSTLYLGRLADGSDVLVRVAPRAPDDPTIPARLKRAQAATRLDHPHVVPARAVGATPSFLWYATAVSPDRALTRRLREGTALPWMDCVHIMQQVAQAMQYAHDRGVVHGGLSPDCIVLETSGWVRVRDFGMAPLLGIASPAPDGLPVAAEDLAGLASVLMGCAVGSAAGAAGAAGFPSASSPPADTQRPIPPGAAPAESRAPGLRRQRILPVDPPHHDERGWIKAAGALGVLAALTVMGLGPRRPGPAPGPGADLAATTRVARPAADPALPELPPEPGFDIATPAAPRASRRSPARAADPPDDGPAPPPQLPAPPADPGPEPSTTAVVVVPAPPAGRLLASSRPWGQLFVDGRLIGTTPRNDVALTAGAHVIAIVRPGYQAFTQRVTVAPGQTIRLTDITLTASP